MFFKNELPPPRYAISGEFEDSELLQDVEHSISLEGQLDGPLLLLAPRLTAIARDLGGTAAGNVRLHTTTRPRPWQLADTADFYETEANPMDFSSVKVKTFVVQRGPAGFLVAVLPVLTESEAAFLGSQLIEQLRPEQLLVAVPGLSFMEEPLCYISTASCKLTLSVPPARPPVLVQGPCASAMSRAQKLNLPALALVVSADGPANHEVCSSRGVSLLRNELLWLLGVTIGRIEEYMSVLYV